MIIWLVIDFKNFFDGCIICFIDDLWIFVLVIIYVVDVGSDLFVCVKYYKEKNFWWFSFMLGFVFVVLFVM